MKNNLAKDLNKVTCPYCKAELRVNLGEHIKIKHGEKKFKEAVLGAKENGMSDPEIGERFNITFRQLERIITEAYGINISILKKPKKPKGLSPKNFKEETSTVWSFEQRGNWATHDGRYRGNWSPYIPRNVIRKYCDYGDTVLDYFIGGGTTAIEAKLLGMKCKARDINPAAIGLTLENLKFDLQKPLFEKHPTYEPEIKVGDARNLKGIANRSIDLIVAHPPYAGIINYSSKVKGDLSKLSINNFLKEMREVADESYRVLKPGKKCAILIGDTRKHKFVIPIGFWTIRVFLDAGFNLKELVIKRQHKCKTTGFWYDRSIKYNFLLLAHEYLPIFEKPKKKVISINHEEKRKIAKFELNIKKQKREKIEDIESTTVWIFPERDMEERIKQNILERFAKSDRYIEVRFNEDKIGQNTKNGNIPLVYIAPPNKVDSIKGISSFRFSLKSAVYEISKCLAPDGFLVIDVKDIRINELIHPMGLNVLEDMSCHDNFKIKEIIIVTPNNKESNINKTKNSNQLDITHRYLLVFINKRGGIQDGKFQEVS